MLDFLCFFFLLSSTVLFHKYLIQPKYHDMLRHGPFWSSHTSMKLVFLFGAYNSLTIISPSVIWYRIYLYCTVCSNNLMHVLTCQAWTFFLRVSCKTGIIKHFTVGLSWYEDFSVAVSTLWMSEVVSGLRSCLAPVCFEQKPVDTPGFYC